MPNSLDQNTKPFLSIVITQYNELNNLKAGALDRLFEYMYKQTYTWEVILNDDASTDGSTEYSERYSSKNVIYLKSEHKGKGGGLYEGLKHATGEWVLLTDVDQSTPMYEIEKLLPFCDEYEVIIGSRGHNREANSILRKLASFVWRNLRKALMLRHINDTSCGFKLFKTEPLKRLFPHLDVISNFQASGWNVTAFDVELLFMFEKIGYTIKEVEVEWRNEDISDSKDRKFVKESIDMAKQIFKVFANNLKGRYEKI